MNRSGPGSIAGIGSEKMTNEESFLFQKLFRGHFGSDQINNLANLRAPYVNRFMLDCFKGGIESKPVTELQHADVVLIFNSDLPSEYPVGGNSIRKGAVFTGTDIIIANPRDVVFNNEALTDIRLTFTHGQDLAVINRMIRIIIDEKLVDLKKAKSSVANFDDLVKSLEPYTADAAEKMTGLSDEILTQAAKRFAREADPERTADYSPAFLLSFFVRTSRADRISGPSWSTALGGSSARILRYSLRAGKFIGFIGHQLCYDPFHQKVGAPVFQVLRGNVENTPPK